MNHVFNNSTKMPSSVIHPSPLDDIERGKLSKGISRKFSINLKEKKDSREPRHYGLRMSSSCPSLSAELVEAVMCDGQFRYVNERAHKSAMWCGLISFMIFTFAIILIGFLMALKLI